MESFLNLLRLCSILAVLTSTQTKKTQQTQPTDYQWQLAPDKNSFSLKGAFKKKLRSKILAYIKKINPERGGTDVVREDIRSSSVWMLTGEDSRERELVGELLMHLIDMIASSEAMESWTFLDGVSSLQPAGAPQVALYNSQDAVPGHYAWHADTAFLEQGSDKGNRMLSVTVQLSSPQDYQGGELKVGEHIATKDRGSLTLFPSYVLHTVRPTTAGSRYSLVAWFQQGEEGGNGQLPRRYFQAGLKHYKSLEASPKLQSEERGIAASLCGQVLQRTRDANGAIAAFQRSLLLNPADYHNLLAMGELLGKQGRHAEAASSFENALKQNPSQEIRKKVAKARQHLEL